MTEARTYINSPRNTLRISLSSWLGIKWFSCHKNISIQKRMKHIKHSLKSTIFESSLYPHQFLCLNAKLFLIVQGIIFQKVCSSTKCSDHLINLSFQHFFASKHEDLLLQGWNYTETAILKQVEGSQPNILDQVLGIHCEASCLHLCM